VNTENPQRPLLSLETRRGERVEGPHDYNISVELVTTFRGKEHWCAIEENLYDVDDGIPNFAQAMGNSWKDALEQLIEQLEENG